MNTEYLNETEKDLIIAFNSNTKMVEAVKKAILYTVYNQGLLRPGEPAENTNWVFGIFNNTDDKEEMIFKMTSTMKGLGFLQEAFKRLSEFKKAEEPKKKENPAI